MANCVRIKTFSNRRCSNWIARKIALRLTVSAASELDTRTSQIDGPNHRRPKTRPRPLPRAPQNISREWKHLRTETRALEALVADTCRARLGTHKDARRKLTNAIASLRKSSSEWTGSARALANRTRAGGSARWDTYVEIAGHASNSTSKGCSKNRCTTAIATRRRKSIFREYSRRRGASSRKCTPRRRASRSSDTAARNWKCAATPRAMRHLPSAHGDQRSSKC